MSIELANVHHAAASVDCWTREGSLSGPNPPIVETMYRANRGFSGDPKRLGTGEFLLTLDVGVADAECIIQVTSRSGSTPAFPTVEHASDTVKAVRLFDTSGAGVDVSFDVVVHKIAG